MAIGTDEVLPGGIEPQFRVDVSAKSASYRRGAAMSSVDELTAAFENAASHQSFGTAIVVVTAIAAVVALATKPVLIFAVFAAGVALFVWSAGRDARMRRVGILYRFEQEDAANRFDSLANGVGWLASSRAVWRVTHEERAASGFASVIRSDAAVARGAVANVLTNLAIPSVAAAGETLLFFPDALVIRRGTSFRAVPYAAIRTDLEVIHFREDGAVPPDSTQVGLEWRYAKKDGSADRRRANNYQIPVVEYARVTLTWPGSGCVLLVSHIAGARHFAASLGISKPKPVPATPEVDMRITISPSPDLVRALQASLDRKQREQELERERAAAVPATPAPAAQRATKGEWLPAGRSATVHGFVTGELVYVGNSLLALDGYRVEPSLINPALPVDPSYANTSGDGVSYWPSYSTITASSRRAFLQWLAGGRQDRNTSIGYVFLFFYGLERRVYEFVQDRGSNADEVLAIAREVARLLDLYGSNHSFASYAGSLLDAIALIEPRARELLRDTPRAEYGPSQRLKLTLAELSVDGKPIPAALALDWVRSAWYLNTPATRCADEFELLFHIRYARQFGEGLVVKPNKTCIDTRYRPASAGLSELTLTNTRVPDITQLSRPLNKLVELASECSNALDAFSRFLGKNPDGRGTLAAFGLLPDDLVEATHSADASALASLVRSRLDADGRAHLAAGELLQYVRIAKPGKVSKNEAMLLAQALEKLGYGIEPDVRLGGPVYEPDGRVVVFRRLDDCPSTASDEYATATLCMRLGAIVSAADDDVSETERTLLQKHISETLQLSAGERQRLAAHLAWLLEEKPGTNGLKKHLAALTSGARHHIGQLLITVATTDGRVDPREMKILEKLYDLVGLSAADLYADIHAALATDEEPVAVDRSVTPPKGFAIPTKPAAATTATGIDMDRVRLKIAETREVSTLLSSIFTEEEAQPAAAPRVAQANTVGTLDAAHSELLRRLAERESWPRDEVERLAGELALLPDGALETINDYAYAAADQPFWEDDDPVAINSTVAMELIA